ncbi:MAG: MetS family NSS transporter small subunit [Desulfobacteraceae bacterium]|nr:MetS family NSS transporter small subunit [Desulfobacteraceae bacterium]MBC2757795.1 MetS family NSS transporter small subunit [Desulfobacteraceae bacterium]
MTLGAILMMMFGIFLTWGGASVCIAIAIKKRNI